MRGGEGLGSRRRRGGGLEGGGLPPPLMAFEEAESFRESAPRCMDDEIDGATPSRAAQVIEELLAVDADG